MKYRYLLITLFIAIMSNNALAQKKCPEYGDWNNRCYGKYTHDNGLVQEGQWHNNYMHGQGTEYATKGEWAGSKYVGEFKEGKYHGQGTFTYGEKSEWASDKYVGEYKEGKYHGQGTYYYGPKRKAKEFAGDKYVGEFKEGEFHGQGTYYFGPKHHSNSGDKYVGEFKKGKSNGYGVYTWSDGTYYRGYWKDWVRHGEGTEVYPDGYVRKGKWVDDVYSDYSDSIEKNKEENSKKNSYSSGDKVFPAASGTAFSISKDGYLITNDHVISECKKLTVHNDKLKSDARVILNDPQNDLALLKTNLNRLSAIPLSVNKAALMQEIYVAGYPFGDYYSSSVKVTKGIVSALSGVGNNFSNFQIDAALQPGNSGGPVIDEKGNLIGVAVAKLDQSKTFDDFGSLPENTNFAIKTGVVMNIIDAAKIEPRQANERKLSRDKLARLIMNNTFHVTCFMTESQIKEIQSQAEKDKVLFKNIKFN